MKALLVLAGPISRDKYKVLDIKSIEEAREFMPGNTPDHILFSIAMSEGGGEEHGCILFMDVGEEAEEERRETNVLTNEWLYSHNNMPDYIHGNVLVYGMSYNGTSNMCDVGDIIVESFKDQLSALLED